MVNPGWTDLDRGLFSISVAAELAGLHPQTLRIYEREGLLDPARSAGGTRRYSRRDIGRLQEICTLTADGLNLAGIRRVLQLQEETRELQAELARLRELVGARPAQRNGAGSSVPARPPTSSRATLARVSSQAVLASQPFVQTRRSGRALRPGRVPGPGCAAPRPGCAPWSNSSLIRATKVSWRRP